MLTYEEARDLVTKARNGRKKLENNTYLEERWNGTRDGDLPRYAIRLHNTDVVTLHPDGSYTLDSGGWRTVTTKARISHYAPGTLGSDRGTWNYYPTTGDWETRYTFADGMTIHADGTVAGAGIDESAIRRT